MIKALIFDCFGVLVRDGLEVAIEKQELIDGLQSAEHVRSVVRAFANGSLNAEVAQNEVTKLLNIDEESYLELITGSMVKNEPLLNYIKQLRIEYKIALLSNTSLNGLSAWFSRFELDEYFDSVNVSGEIGHAKPQPDAFGFVAHQLGSEPFECIMIDDRADYCNGAGLAGMQSLQFINNAELLTKLSDLLAL